jgi:tetratricopeptide (TPR) repeat protein
MAVRTPMEAMEAIRQACLKRTWLLSLLLVVTILLTFSNAFGREFIWDDISLIAQNRFVRGPGNLPRLLSQDLWGFARDEGRGHDLYRPLVSLSYWIDFRLWGDRPPFYHLTNLLFHTLSSLAVYFTLRAMPVGRGAAWLGALFFALHPIHTESVTWISGRTDVICGFFFFLGFFLYLNYRREERWPYLVGSLIAFLLALLAKEMAVTLPLVIVLYGLCFGDAPWPGRWREFGRSRLWPAVKDSLPYWAVVVLYLAIRLSVLGAVFQSGDRAAGLFNDASGWRGVRADGIGATLLLSAKVVALYLRLLLLPYPLNAHRLVSDLEAASGLVTWLSPLVGIAVLGLGLWALRRAPAYAFAALFVLVAVLPVSWLFPVGDHVAERFLYIPSLAVCLAAALLGTQLWRWKKAVGLAVVLLVGLSWAALTLGRNVDWRDSMTFWSKTAAASPRSTIAHNFLGLEFWYRGQHDRAIVEFERSLEIDEGDKNAYNNLGAVYSSQGRYPEAQAALQKAVALAPETALFHFNLGVVHERLGDPEQAIAAYQEALALDPFMVSAYYNLGLLYHRLESWAEAIFYFERLLDIEPGSIEAHNGLGMVYLQLQLYPQALFEFEQALRLDPQSVQALNNLGLAFLNKEEFERALSPLEKAVQLDPEFAAAHFNLGLAYLESGSRDKALRELAIAVELDPANEEARRLIRELGGQ